jgi:DNA-binding CsgD family transcriptional regulator
MQLSSKDLAALLDVIQGTYAQRTVAALGGYLCGAVRRAVPAENNTYSEFDPRPGHQHAVELMDPPGHLTSEAQAIFRRFVPEHPLIAHYARSGDGRARKISDFLTGAQLRRLALYNEYVRPFFGLNHQIAIAMTATPSRVVGVSLARSGRDFSERDRGVLDLLRPHIVQAHRNAAAFDRMAADVSACKSGVDAMDRGLVSVDRALRVRVMNTRARLWLQEYFGRVRSALRLPDDVRYWILTQPIARLSSTVGPPVPSPPLTVCRDGYQLTIRLVPDADGYLLLLEQEETERDPAAFEAFGLTRREAEVMSWVAAGKTSAETATILGGRPRTVEKHLERIYRKLGVENRTAAAGVVRNGGSRPS